PLQTVIKKGSLATGDSSKDFVSPAVYDDLGRETYKYLPFEANSTGGNTSITDGKFKLNPFQQDSTYNKGMFSGETYYYSKTIFEISPLNRPSQNYSQGDNWVGSAGSGAEVDRHGTKSKYWINTIADSVRLWIVSEEASGMGSYSTPGIYPPGSLFKTVIQDEHNNQIVEFKDKRGNVILKKVQLTASADDGTGRNHNG